MKYVIFKHKTGCLMPVITPQHVTHSSISIEDAIPVSAGFFTHSFVEGAFVHGESESLKLRPLLGDAELLNAVFNNSGMYAFLPM